MALQGKWQVEITLTPSARQISRLPKPINTFWAYKRQEREFLKASGILSGN